MILNIDVPVNMSFFYKVPEDIPKTPRCSKRCKNGGCTGQTGPCFGVCYCHGVCII